MSEEIKKLHSSSGKQPMRMQLPIATLLVKRVRRLHAFWRWLSISLLASVLIWAGALRPRQLHLTVRAVEEDALPLWIRHVHDYPVHPKDRYAFQEMGFRTYMYAETMRRGMVDTFSLEEALWTFTPGIETLRTIAGIASPEYEGSPSLKKVLYRYANPKRRGIVTYTDHNLIRSTLELISTVRATLDCDLPIEVFYRGQQQIPLYLAEALEALPGVRLVDIQHLTLFDEEELGHEDLMVKEKEAHQAIAMLATSFTEFIYMAPGTIFYTNPSDLFNEPGYRKTGTHFFHDINQAQEADSHRLMNFLRQQFDEKSPSKQLSSSPFYNYGVNHHQDPSVVALDKSRPGVFASLLLNLWMHTREARDKIWYAHFPESLVETLWLSFELSNIPYYFQPSYPGAIGTFEGSFDELPWDPKICPAHPLHRIGSLGYATHTGTPAWSGGGLRVFPFHPQYLQPGAWSYSGSWQQTPLGMCVTGADAHSLADFGIGDKFEQHHIVDQAFGKFFEPLLVLESRNHLASNVF